MCGGTGRRSTGLVAGDKQSHLERVGVAVSLLTALVALAVAFTNERPTSAVAVAVLAVLLAAAGLVHLWTARSSDGKRRFPHVRYVAAAVAVGVAAATVVALTTPSLRRTTAHDVFGFPDVSRDVAIVSFAVSESPEWYRLDLMTLNKTSTEQLVTSARIVVYLTEDAMGNCGGTAAYYRVNEVIRVVREGPRSAARVDGTVQTTEGPPGFTTPVTGGFDRYCTEGVLRLAFATQVVLVPGEHTKIELDLPKQVVAPEPFPYPDDYVAPTVSPDPNARIFLWAASVFRVTLCVADPPVPVSRHHLVAARPPWPGWELDVFREPSAGPC
jgi:hypothetical protein